MKCVEKIAEYLNYACRHHRFRIFLLLQSGINVVYRFRTVQSRCFAHSQKRVYAPLPQRFERLIRFLDRYAVPTGRNAGPRCCLGCCAVCCCVLCSMYVLLLCCAVLVCMYVYVLVRLCMCVFSLVCADILAIFLASDTEKSRFMRVI